MTHPNTREKLFYVGHQKVSIDVDLQENCIQGWTELTIVPTDHNLRQVRLDCRHLQVHNVLINGRKASFEYNDLLSNAKPIPGSTVYQHHQYKKKIDELMKDTLPGELVIHLPKGMRILPQDNGSVQLAEEEGLVPKPIDAAYYRPLVAKIEYSLSKPNTGFTFVGGKSSIVKRSYWHAYTNHSPIGQATSNWLPCIDGLWELCTWELEISVPRTIQDIGNPKLDDSEEENNVDGEEDKEVQEILVVCNSTFPLESKKVVSFNLTNPISAHHIGFSVGPFVQTPILDLRDNELEDEEEDSTSVPISVFTLSNRVNEATNSCAFLYKAMEFFTREYGSYPFQSYSVCFVSEAISKVASAAGLSICDEKLLFPPNAIEPLFTSTEDLTVALTSQWCGVNIVPEDWNSIWVSIGISHYMAQSFLRRLFGNNDYRYKMKKKSEEIRRRDINKPPLADPGFQFPITDKDLAFIILKAPVVLFILDRRMTKTDRSLGMSRVLPKLFLQSMSGDLNSCLSTTHFIRLCERVCHSRLESFFEQWVYGCGYPIFRVTQRFNKKRMFIEMGIRQVQASELQPAPLDESEFVSDAKGHLDKNKPHPTQPVFTGPMTIRIHEADGTPYEHVVEIKEAFTKLDIQYNTKYKRLKRERKNQKDSNIDLINVDNEDAEFSGVLLHCLGDVLQSNEDIQNWNLNDWTKEEEERMGNEAFEWIRIDSDFEWICVLYINQPDYMFYSQLQQDRDVVAQYDAVRFFRNQKPSNVYSSILVRTLMDRRYYYGIRVEAAYALTSCAVEEVRFIGKFHLMKTFQSLFCFEGSMIPAANDFTDFPTYFLQKAIPSALARIRDSSGNCPMDVKNFLVDVLRYNENSSNPFSDCYYISSLIESLVDSIVTKGQDGSMESYRNKEFVTKAHAEIDRNQRIDGWMPSLQNMITVTAIQQKSRLARQLYIPVKFEELIQATRPGNSYDVRVAAFKSIMDLGGLQNKALCHYLFVTLAEDMSGYLRDRLVEAICQSIGLVAIQGDIKTTIGDGRTRDGGSSRIAVVEGISDSLAARKEALARTTIAGAIELARQSFETLAQFKRELWAVINNTDKFGIVEKKKLFEVCMVLYKPANNFIITLPTPRFKVLKATKVAPGKIVIKRETVFKLNALQPSTKRGKDADKVLKAKNKDPKISLVTEAAKKSSAPKLKIKLKI